MKFLMILLSGLALLACTDPLAKPKLETDSIPGKVFVGINTVIPSGGPLAGGTRLRLLGLGFSIDSKVKLGTLDCANTTYINVNEMDCTTPGPHGLSESLDVVVTNPNGTEGTLASGFTFRPGPTVTAIAPVVGVIAGGTGVTITGTGFVTGAQVLLGGTLCGGLTVVSATQMTCLTAAHAVGTVDVVVTNSDSQTATLTNGYSFHVPPTVTSVSPNGGNLPGGTAVTITGTGFVTGATLSFGGTSCGSVAFVNATTLTCTTAAHAAGAVNVVVANPDTLSATLASGFTYRSPPTVTAISPAVGALAGGTSVTVTGTGFVNGITVKLDGITCGTVTFVSATSLTCVTPGPHIQAAVALAVTNPDTQTASLASAYTYMDPPLAPSALVAAATSESAVLLTWTDNSNNESQFRIERSTDNITFAQITATAANAVSFSDTGLTRDQIYYYRVRAYNLAANSAYSNVANATPIGVHLEVPIEMMDTSVTGATSAVTWLRTRTSLNTTDYDGTVTYRFEVVCSNTSAAALSVALYNSVDASKATVSIPASTALPTRFDTTWTPTAGAEDYRLQTPAVASGTLTCHAARILVQQVNATKTKLYIPLVSDVYNKSDSDNSVLGSTIDTGTTNTYGQLAPTHYSLWHKDVSRFADLVAGTPWTLEVVMGAEISTGRAALFNKTTGFIVLDSEIIGTATSPTLFTKSFADTATDFTNLNDFELRIRRSGGGGANIHHLFKAGLWVQLSNLNKADVYYRTARSISSNASLVVPHSRVKIDMTRFMNIIPASFYSEVVGSEPVVGTSDYSLRSAGTSDSATTGTDFVSSLINFNSTVQAGYRSTALTPVSGDRFVPSLAVTSGTLQVNTGFVVISIAK